jgi:N-carbamoylputrescine amidase
MAARVTVGLVQMRCTRDIEANVEKSIARIRDAAAQGAQIVCLQELFNTPYLAQVEEHEHFDWAEPIPGPTTQRMAALSKELDLVLIVPLFERRGPGMYHNSLAVYDGGETAGIYRKMHIPDDPQYHEKFYFTPGDLGFRTFDTRFGRIGALICWDQWFPEGARLLALQGAQIIFYPTAIGYLGEPAPDFGEANLRAWQMVQRGHAIANGCFVAAVNRVGIEEEGRLEGLQFWGHSFVSDPLGQMMAEAGGDETILLARCDLNFVEEVRRHWPFLRDRRIDAYGSLLKRWDD